MNCPVCDSASITGKWVLRDRFFAVTTERFKTYLCGDCGALFLDQDHVRDRLAEFYPTHYWWAPAGAAGRLEDFYRKWVLKRDHLSFVKRALGRYSNPECLEIGCGSGTFTGMALKEGINITGLEISTEAVAEACSQGITCIKTGTVEDAVARGESYDAVILFHVLEHLCDPREFMGKVARIVREGGSLILQVPNRSSWQARLLGRRWYGLDCPRHVCNYSSEALENLVASSGFRIERTETFSLRDNAPAFVSSLIPWLDPLGSRVKILGAGKTPGRYVSTLRGLLYFGLVLAAQPFAWLESLFGRGATIKLAAVRENQGKRL